jgi:hypothetical protein
MASISVMFQCGSIENSRALMRGRTNSESLGLARKRRSLASGIVCLSGLSGGSRCFDRVSFFTPLQKALKQLLGLLVSNRLARR